MAFLNEIKRYYECSYCGRDKSYYMLKGWLCDYCDLGYDFEDHDQYDPDDPDHERR